MQIKEFQSEENAGERIDKFLTEKVPELSRSYIQKLIKEKNVKVNSTVIKSNYKVAKGDQIQITIPDLTEPDILPENIPLDILYEDDDILVRSCHRIRCTAASSPSRTARHTLKR